MSFEPFTFPFRELPIEHIGPIWVDTTPTPYSSRHATHQLPGTGGLGPRGQGDPSSPLLDIRVYHYYVGRRNPQGPTLQGRLFRYPCRDLTGVSEPGR